MLLNLLLLLLLLILLKRFLKQKHQQTLRQKLLMLLPRPLQMIRQMQLMNPLNLQTSPQLLLLQLRLQLKLHR